MQVMIVGAGPAGAALALLLARQQVAVTLIEQADSLARVFRGEGLMPAGMDALHQMGLAELLDNIPCRQLESWNIFLEGKEIFVIPEPLRRLGSRALSIVSQTALLEGMIDQAKAYPNFTFLSGTQVQEVVRDDQQRIVGVTVNQAGQSALMPADLVIGCDGRGSTVRRKAGLTLTLLPDQYDVLWFKLPAPVPLQNRCQFYLMARGKTHPAACYTSWDGRLQYGLIMPKGGLAQLGEQDWLTAAMAPAPTWLADHMQTHRAAVSAPVRLNVMVGRCPQWRVPGGLLLGDAAHPMSPVRAQGVNLALRDAIVAANHLVPALRSGQAKAIDAATAAIQTERMPEVVRSQTLQLRESESLNDIRNATWKLALAQRLVPLVGKLPIAQWAWLFRQRQLRFGVTPVQLTSAAE
ncbi:MAG: FAD-dependent monooxygenase [Cyanobacteria bacterium P01_A01_bin.105]